MERYLFTERMEVGGTKKTFFHHHLYSRLNTELVLALMISPDGKIKR